MFNKKEYEEKVSKMSKAQLATEWELAAFMLNPYHVEPERLKKITQCKNCPYCEKKTGVRGRNYYVCSFTNIKDFIPDRYKGYNNVIAFENKGTKEVAIKTKPRWCPVTYCLNKKGV